LDFKVAIFSRERLIVIRFAAGTGTILINKNTIMEIKQIKDLKAGEIFTNSYQFKGHARIFVKRTELQKCGNLHFVIVKYKDPQDGKLYEADYSLDWEVWTYENLN
jgi:hypothetical protein